MSPSIDDSSLIDLTRKVLEIVSTHNRWRRLETINLIASENVMSPLAEYVYLNDMMGRYAEGPTGNKYYQGTKYMDMLEKICNDLMCRLFNAKYADVRPVSGTVANIAALYAITEAGDLVASLPISAGAHISHRKVGAVGVLRLRTVDLPWDPETLNIDLDRAVKVIEEKKPKVVILGASVYLFPHPMKEIADVAHSIGALVVHDSAHVLGLIAGKVFPNPLENECDIMTASTHKTFPGPQGGVVFTNRMDLAEKLDKAVFPGVTSNYHQHRYPSLAITAIEMLKYGEEYARQIVRNAQKLAEALAERGFKVLGEPLGYTRTHQVLLDVSKLGGGAKCASLLEEANIIVNKNMLPGDKAPDNPSGIRIGVQEMTRFGMKENEMETIADFMAKILIEGRDPAEVKPKVVEFRKEFTKIHYGFSIKDFENVKYCNIISLLE